MGRAAKGKDRLRTANFQGRASFREVTFFRPSPQTGFRAPLPRCKKSSRKNEWRRFNALIYCKKRNQRKQTFENLKKHRVFIGFCYELYYGSTIRPIVLFQHTAPKSDIETKNALFEKERQHLPMCIFLGLYPFSKKEPMLCTGQHQPQKEPMLWVNFQLYIPVSEHGHKIYPGLAEVCWSAIAHLRESSRIRYWGITTSQDPG